MTQELPPEQSTAFYTPTPDQMKDAYVKWRMGFADMGIHFTQAFEEFDRWFAEEIRKAQKQAWAEGAEYAHKRNGIGYGYTLDANPYTEES